MKHIMDASSSSTSSNSIPPYNLPSTTTAATNAVTALTTTTTMSASESSDDVPALTGASSSSSTAVGPVMTKPIGGGSSASSAPGIGAVNSSSSVQQHVPPQQTGPISIQQWFNPHHLLTGALLGGGGASQIDAPSNNSSSGSGDVAVGPEPQPHHHHQWLAAGMEIIAGMMNPQSATQQQQQQQQQGDVAVCESTPVWVEVGDVAASSSYPSSSSSSGGDSPQDNVQGSGGSSSNDNIVIIKALRRNRDADDDSSIPPPPPPPSQHAMLVSAHSMDGEFSIGTSTSDSSSAYPLKRAHHHHPFALRRSSSSAFGSPCISTTSSGGGVGVGGIIPMRTRTLSNGYSDPGTATTTASTSNSSAFHAWSCRSLYSNDGVGSDVSSAISSSVAYSGGLSSTNSDPFPQKSSNPNRIKIGESSPWRRVMNRMKKTTVKRPTFGRSLSGRENPARPNLSDDEVDQTPPLRGGSYVFVDNAGDEEVEIVNPNLDEKPPTSVVSVGGSKSSSSRKKKKRNKKKKKSKNKISSSPQSKGESDVDGFYDRGKPMTVATVATTKTKDNYTSYDDPGVALDLSDDSDTDDDDCDVFKSIVDEGDIPSQSFTNKSIMPPSQVSGRVYDPKPPPEQVDCDGIEVVSAMREASATSQNTTIMDSESSSVLGSVQIFSPIITSITPIDENSPPSVERYTTILEDLRPGGTETDTSSLYHPFGCGGNVDDDDVPDDELDDKCRHSVSNIQFTAGNPPQVQLKYRAPQRSVTSPSRPTLPLGTAGDHSPSSSDSRLSSLGGSPSSRISSSNSRSTTSTLNSGGDRTINTLRSIDGSLVMDSEIREANRRSIRGWRRCVGSNGSGSSGGDETINQDAIVGNETALSSSTTSSKYHTYYSSPRPLRDGATLPVDRFFAGGNVPMSPSPPREEFAAGATHTMSTTTPSMSKFFCPKTLSRNSTRDSTHSPHTISSASVSATSSSGSETKRPLQFVAYQIREERESPFDEPPGYSHITTYATVGSGTCGTGDDMSNACPPLIKPRIYKNDSSNQQNQSRPPMIQRPSAVVIQQQLTSPRYGRSRTPTRTPPPSSYMPSSAANTPSSPPVIIDGPSNVEELCAGDGNTKLVQPTLSRPQQLDASMISDDNNVVRNTIMKVSRVGHLDTVEESVVTVTPDKFPFPNTARRLHLVAPKCEKTNVITPPERKS